MSSAIIDEKYKIFPIFSQDQDLWGQIGDMEEADLINRKLLNPGEMNKDAYINECEKMYDKNIFNFAFSAWDNKKLIGVSAGYVEMYKSEPRAIIENLIVLPEYRNQNIGRTLLTQTTDALVFNTRLVFLDPSEKEINFCKNNGFMPSADNLYKKIIQIPSQDESVVPIFYINNGIKKEWKVIAKTDRHMVNPNDKVDDASKYKNENKSPMFVLIKNEAIDAISLQQTSEDGANQECRLSVNKTLASWKINQKQVSDRLASHYYYFKSLRKK